MDRSVSVEDDLIFDDEITKQIQDEVTKLMEDEASSAQKKRRKRKRDRAFRDSSVERIIAALQRVDPIELPAKRRSGNHDGQNGTPQTMGDTLSERQRRLRETILKSNTGSSQSQKQADLSQKRTESPKRGSSSVPSEKKRSERRGSSSLLPAGYQPRTEKQWHCPVVACIKTYSRKDSLCQHINKRHINIGQKLQSNSDGTMSILEDNIEQVNDNVEDVDDNVEEVNNNVKEADDNVEEDDLDWEIEGGIVYCSQADNNGEDDREALATALAFDASVLTTNLGNDVSSSSINGSDASFSIISIHPGDQHVFEPLPNSLRFCSITQGQAYVEVEGDKAFNAGLNDMFRVRAGVRVSVYNLQWQQILIHVTRIVSA